MSYLSHRFSRLTSLVMLLVMSIGTAWLFSFVTRANAVAEGLISAYADQETTNIPIRNHRSTSGGNVSGSTGRAY